MSTPTVFLSAASIDLKEWRDVLHDAFSRGGFRVLTQDHSLSSAPGDVKRLLTETIDESDCIIHLAGLGYGSDATAPFPADPAFQCSWTQFEYYHGHQEKKDVIAFVCAPSLSKPGFIEKGSDDADIARKQRLQQEHRQRVAQGTFEHTPVTAPRTSNERIDSIPTLLTAVAAAVGTLHKLDRDACAKAQAELTLLAHDLAEVKQEVVKTKEEVVKTRCFGIGAFAVLCLMLALLGAGVWHLMQGQKPNPERIRAAYREASERKLAEDNTESEKASTSVERQRLHEAATAAHEARIARIEYHVADFIRLADDPATTFVMREMIRILSDPKENDRVKTALDYADKQKAGVLERIRTRNAAIAVAQHEQNRTELQPLLKTADLQATSGKVTEARSSYVQILEFEPDWPEALISYGDHLLDWDYPLFSKTFSSDHLQIAERIIGLNLIFRRIDVVRGVPDESFNAKPSQKKEDGSVEVSVSQETWDGMRQVKAYIQEMKRLIDERGIQLDQAELHVQMVRVAVHELRLRRGLGDAERAQQLEDELEKQLAEFEPLRFFVHMRAEARAIRYALRENEKDSLKGFGEPGDM